MKISITIDTTGNSAFDYDNCGSEVARILRKLAEGMYGDTLEGYVSKTLRDFNGNNVGRCEISDN